MIVDLLRAGYLLCVLVLAVYSLGSAALFVVYLLNARRIPPAAPARTASALPTVCVQLPIYNEPHVTARLIDAAACQDYPAHLFSIQILDDSTDSSSAIAAERAAYWRAHGVRISHLHRTDRAGYKAGALDAGLKQTDAECIAIFDADFVPPPDSVRAAVSWLAADPTVGMVQTRWAHLNAGANNLTGALALALDTHFVVEQTARLRGGWLLNFNGSGGVWRTQAIHAAGGWRADTLTEDLDLSYRAQLAGWRLDYHPELSVPGEIPATFSAYRQQQQRWARGGSQVFARLIGSVWRSPRLTLAARFMATLHLAQYLVNAVLLTVILITPILIAARALPAIDFGLFGLAGLVPPLMVAAGQWALYPDAGARVARGLPRLIVIASGMTWCSARASLAGLVRVGGEFRRTPKAGATTQAAIIIEGPPIAEAALCAYCLFGLALALAMTPAAAPYLGLYVLAFGGMAIAVWRERWAGKRQVR